MEPRAVDRAAGDLHDAFVERRLLPAWSEGRRPRDLASAYAIQRSFVRRIGAPSGYKIGYTNSAIQERFGVDAPISGRMFPDRILESPARLPASSLLRLAVEPEFAYRIAEDLLPAEAPFDRGRMIGAVDALAPSLEIVESRFQSWETIGPLLTVADNVLHSHWVHGEIASEWDHDRLPEHEVVAFVEEREFSRGDGSNVLGDPLESLLWLANDLAARGETLLAGEWVTTGCCTAVIECRPGDTVRADFGSLGSVSITFDDE